MSTRAAVAIDNTRLLGFCTFVYAYPHVDCLLGLGEG
jgi:hypothetical protein